MPKATSHSVIAQNRVTMLYERITPNKDIRDKYKDVGKLHHVRKPKPVVVITPKLSPEEYQELEAEYREEMLRKRLISRITLHERKLADRISSPPPPLIQRIAPAEPEAPAPPTELPKFHKTKILKRIDEFNIIFDATHKRLRPLIERLQVEDELEDEDKHVRVEIDTRRMLWEFWDWLQLAREQDEFKHELTNAQWRKMKGNLKRIGKVDLSDLENRLETICNDLVALNIHPNTV